MRFLVLGGGGSRGALQVGWLRSRTERGAAFDRVFGTSVGAINALHLGHYRPESHQRAAMDLEARWVSLRGTGDVLGPLASTVIGALVHGALYTTEPLERRLRGWYDKGQFGQIPVGVGVSGIASGTHRIVSLLRAEDPIPWVLASASYPLAMQPVRIGADLYRDGGVVRVCPVADAIMLGVKEIDAVSCSPLRRPPPSFDLRKVGPPLHDLGRVLEMMSSSVAQRDYDAARAAWLALEDDQRPIVRWWWPTLPPIEDPMSFEAADIERAIGAGYDLGKGSPTEVWPA